MVLSCDTGCQLSGTNYLRKNPANGHLMVRPGSTAAPIAARENILNGDSGNFPTSGVDLTFATPFPGMRKANVKSKTPPETCIC
jgi:hypothetical protein